MKTARVLLALGSWAAWLLVFALVFHTTGSAYHRVVAAGAQFAAAHLPGVDATVIVAPAQNEVSYKVRSKGIEASYAATTIAMDAAGVIFLATVAATPVRSWRRRIAILVLGCTLLVAGMVVLATGLALIPMVERGFVLKNGIARHAAELSRIVYHTGSIMILPSAIWFLFTIPAWRLSLAGEPLEARKRSSRRSKKKKAGRPWLREI